MAIEGATYISQLDPLAPLGTATKQEGDNELRQLKAVLQNQFPNLGAAAVTPTAAQLNTVASKATKTGDTYSGTHDFSSATLTAGTAAAGTANTSAASTAFVQAAVAGVNANGSLTLSIVTDTTATATAGQFCVLTNVAATTLTLPATPSAGNVVAVKVGNGLITNVVAGNSEKIESIAEDLTLNLPYASLTLTYINSTIGWSIA